MKLLTVFLLAASAWAGQSLRINAPGYVYNWSVPASPTNRLEFFMHDWDTSTNGVSCISYPCYIHIFPGSMAGGWQFYMYMSNATSVGQRSSSSCGSCFAHC